MIGYFTKYLSGKDLVRETGSDWKGKQIIPENAKGLRVWSTARVFSKRATTNFAWNGFRTRTKRLRMARLAAILKLGGSDEFRELFGMRYRWHLSEVIASVNVSDLCPEGDGDLRPDQHAEMWYWDSLCPELRWKRLLYWPPRPNRQSHGWPSPNRSREGWNLSVLVKALEKVWWQPGPFSVPEQLGLDCLPFRFDGKDGETAEETRPFEDDHPGRASQYVLKPRSSCRFEPRENRDPF